MATFESMDRRMPKIEACLKANGLESLDACNEMLLAKGIDCDKIVRGVQPICFDNAVWAYTLGTAIAVKRGLTDAAECAAAIGEGLEAFTIPGSVAEQRQVGLGHGNLGARLLSEDTTWSYGIAVKSGQDELVGQIDAALRAMVKDGSWQKAAADMGKSIGYTPDASMNPPKATAKAPSSGASAASEK